MVTPYVAAGCRQSPATSHATAQTASCQLCTCKRVCRYATKRRSAMWPSETGRLQSECSRKCVACSNTHRLACDVHVVCAALNARPYNRFTEESKGSHTRDDDDGTGCHGVQAGRVADVSDDDRVVVSDRLVHAGGAHHTRQAVTTCKRLMETSWIAATKRWGRVVPPRREETHEQQLDAATYAASRASDRPAIATRSPRTFRRCRYRTTRSPVNPVAPNTTMSKSRPLMTLAHLSRHGNSLSRPWYTTDARWIACLPPVPCCRDRCTTR